MLAKLAQEIVNITSEVISDDMLITDKDGMVLGSSGAIRKVEEPLKLWILANYRKRKSWILFVLGGLKFPHKVSPVKR